MSNSGVYIVGLRKQPGYCKVGVSCDFAKRLKQLSTGSPFVPFLYHLFSVHSLPRAYAIESAAHDELKEFRVNGEWFNIRPADAMKKIRPLVGNEDHKPFFISPINAPKTIEDCRLATIEIRKRIAAREAAKTIQDQ